MDKEKLQGTELNEEELKQVSGGVEFVVKKVDVGDVFLQGNYHAYIVKSTVVDNRDNPYVPLVCADFNASSNTWQVDRHANMPMSCLNNLTYSQALSGTLNHLLN